MYNGLDTLVTHDVFAATVDQLDEITGNTYAFSKALQGPVLEMRIRGVLVDQARRLETIDLLDETAANLEKDLHRLVFEGFGLITFNRASTADLQHLFYDVLGIRPYMNAGRVTVDATAREKMAKSDPVTTMVIKYIDTIARLRKQIGVLQTEIDNDGRIRTSYNIAGTNTGRFSSSLSEFGTGGNLQNVEESLRSIYIANPGHKFAKADAKSGESYCVGAIEWNRFGDDTYLNAVESGDVHTTVARLVWPDLGWTGQLEHDKAIAERPYYREQSYRFLCKGIGHGSNYGGMSATLAEQAHLPIDIVDGFQRKYFSTFPAHQRWQGDVGARLKSVGNLVSLTGRRRWFFGRRSDPSVLREAIAFDPQGSLADIVNLAMLRVWRARICPVVMHDHDALTFMYPEAEEERILPILREMLVVPIKLANGRELRIPYDIEIGWNKGHYHPVKNPDGLKSWRGPDTRIRAPIRSITNSIVAKHLAKTVSNG